MTMEMEQSYSGATLARRLAADAVASGVSALLVSPAIAIMDRYVRRIFVSWSLLYWILIFTKPPRSIVEQAATRQTLLHGLKKHSLSALRHPVRFFSSPPLRIIAALYGTTYIVNNASESISSEFASEKVVGSIVFASTFAVNVPLGLWKDVRYSQFFGDPAGAKAASQVACAAKTQLAKASTRAPTAAFLVRDAITVFGSFTLPSLVSDIIPHRFVPDAASRAIIAQLTVPVISQIGATPAHVVGLDYYSRRDGASPWQRLSRVRGYIPSITVGRCARIVPAFGIGIVVNKDLRERLRDSMGVS